MSSRRNLPFCAVAESDSNLAVSDPAGLSSSAAAVLFCFRLQFRSSRCWRGARRETGVILPCGWIPADLSHLSDWLSRRSDVASPDCSCRCSLPGQVSTLGRSCVSSTAAENGSLSPNLSTAACSEPVCQQLAAGAGTVYCSATHLSSVSARLSRLTSVPRRHLRRPISGEYIVSQLRTHESISVRLSYQLLGVLRGSSEDLVKLPFI